VRTQEAYIHQVYHLTKYYGRSPDTLTEEEVHAYLIHLAMERHLAASSINQAVNAFRFFYQHVAQEPTPIVAGSSAIAVHVAVTARLSFCR
jgi:site-specific recombinase XerD